MRLILQTPRFTLREFNTHSDARTLFELNSNPNVIKYTGDSAFESVDAAELFLKSYDAYDKTHMGRWMVIERRNGESVGWCGLKQHENFVDLGYRFFEKDWGKGIATETAWACLQYGFKQLLLDEIIGRTASENKSSIAVLKKLGMTFYKSDTCHGIENAQHYSILRANFLPPPFDVHFLS